MTIPRCGQPPLPAWPPIQNVSVWIEKFSLMAALIASCFPEKAPELFAYQASIVRAEWNFDDREPAREGFTPNNSPKTAGTGYVGQPRETPHTSKQMETCLPDAGLVPAKG